MSQAQCPLCGSDKVIQVDKLMVNDLNDLYFSQFKLDIRYLFHTGYLSFNECLGCSLKFFSPSVTGDEHFYNVLQGIEAYYMDEKEEYEIASSFIGNQDKVLEIGSGKGAFLKKIRTLNYTGLEYSVNAAVLAGNEGVHLLNQSIQEHSRNNQAGYDVVCSFQVLEHVDCTELAGFIAAAVACVKPGGKLIISVPAEDSFVPRIINNPLNLPPHHQTRWTDRSLMKLADIYGLRVVHLQHDRLSERLEPEYLKFIVHYALSRKKSLIEKHSNLLQRAARKAITVINRPCMQFIKKVSDPRGHSVTVIFNKLLLPCQPIH